MNRLIDPGKYQILLKPGKVVFEGRNGVFREFPIFQDEETGQALIPLEVLLLIETMQQVENSLSGVIYTPEERMN